MRVIVYRLWRFIGRLDIITREKIKITLYDRSDSGIFAIDNSSDLIGV